MKSKIKKVIIIGVLHSTIFLGLIPYMATQMGARSWPVISVMVTTVIITFVIMSKKSKVCRS